MVSTLLLTQRFPPHQGAAARRLRFLAEQFAKEGKVFVIRKGAEAETLLAVERTTSIPGNDLRKLSGSEGKPIRGSTKENPLVKYLLKMRQAYPFVYLTDDGGIDYRKKAFEAACSLVETEGVTTIFSSFRPWSDHLVARMLKAKYPQLRWIADFRDLPVDIVRKDIWWPALQSWWGRSVVASADEVWTVSEGQKAQLKGWHTNIVVRRNPLLALPPEENNPKTDRFTIVYTGSLYAGLQTIQPLVEALQELLFEGTMTAEKICLQYRGKDTDLFRKWVIGLPEECLDVQPSIAPAAAAKMQYEAQVLLLLNWSAPGYYGVLTAKLWDYLATGRPILALVNGPEDPELQSIISGANAGAVFANDELGLRGWLGEAYQGWEASGSLSWMVTGDELRKYLR
ncbi:MAG: hypothetical protein ACJAZ9_001502 [Neolewinella sp.]|jgi:hypothetical protein